MSRRDIAISSREISAQVVQDGVKTAYIGVPGPPGAQGPAGPQGDPSWGIWSGEWNSAQSYPTGSIVTYQASAGAGVGTYYAYQSVDAGIEPTNAAYWQVLASPGGVGGTTVGPQGPAGPVGIKWRGGWQAGRKYFRNDVVTYGSPGQPVSAWIATRSEHTSAAGDPPFPDDGDNWALLVQAGARGEVGPKGDRGLQGDQGNPGPQGPPGPASTVPGPAGADALAWSAFHFGGDGTLRLVIPEACTMLLGTDHVVTGGSGSYQVYVNGAIKTTSTALAKGDSVAVVASNVGEFFLVTIPFQG